LRDKLRALIRTHGPGLTRDVRRCGGHLRDACEGKARETNLLLGALDEDIPGKLVEQATGPLDLSLRNRLSQLLQENRGFNESAANWAVETWAYALEGLMGTPATPTSTPSSITHQPPVLPADVTQFYLAPHTQTQGCCPIRADILLGKPDQTANGWDSLSGFVYQGPARGPLEYQPRVLGAAEVAFLVDKSSREEYTQTFRLLAEPPVSGHRIDWESAAPVSQDLVPGPGPGAHWAGVPDALDTGRKLKAMEKAFAEWLYNTKKVSLVENRTLGLVSAPGEARSAFQGRCRLAAVEQAKKALAMEKVKLKKNEICEMWKNIGEEAAPHRGQTAED
jgi:hypothetical protein